MRTLLLLQALALLTIAVVGTGTAAATHADTTCSTNEICMWENSSYGGCLFTRTTNTADFRIHNPCHWNNNDFSDDASSAKNKRSGSAVLCKDINYKGGPSANLSANTDYSTLPNNDTASSLKTAWDDCV